MKYICKKFINHQIKKCLLFRCRHAVVIMQTLNWTNRSSVRYSWQSAIFLRSVRMTTHRTIHGNPRPRSGGISTLARRFAPPSARGLSYDENLCVDKIMEWANMRQMGFEPFKVRGRIDSWNSTKLQAEMCNFIVYIFVNFVYWPLLNSLGMARHKLQHTNWAEPM
jgi:hypothetical protein